MSEQVLTVQQLKDRIQELENTQGFVIKKGKVLYIHPPEHITETFTKIEIGVDCSEFFNNKHFPDFVGFAISKFNKELFKQFDHTEGETPTFNVGDTIKFMCEVGSRQSSVDKKKENRTIIYNNVSLVRAKLLSKADITPAGEQGGNKEADFFEKSAEISTDAPTEQTPF